MTVAESVADVVRYVGGTYAMADIFGVAPSTVSGWKKTNTLPARRVPEIAAELGVPLADLMLFVSPPTSKRR